MNLFIMKNKEHDNLILFLQSISYFKDLPRSLLRKLAKQIEPVHIQSGEKLIEQGAMGDCLYIVQTGRLLALKKMTSDKDEIIGDVRRGELIGELALFTEAPRVATIIAIRDSTLWKLSKISFDNFVESNPKHIMPMVKSAMLRLLNPPKKRAAEFNSIALAPAGNTVINQSLIHALIDEFKGKKTCFYVNESIVQNLFPGISFQDNEQSKPVIQWLNVQEGNHDYIIYEVDNQKSSWTQFCLRQADKILLIADSRADKALNNIEKSLLDNPKSVPTPIELVLVHESNITIPQNTSLWLQGRSLTLHHVKKGNRDSIARLVRIVTGNDIALVLGGGGVKSFAEIGVYKALCELGIPIDRVGGTSMGGVLGALIAKGCSWEEILESMERFIAHNKKISDYTLPLVALVKGEGWLQAAKSVYTDHLFIEDLWKSFFCIASNFSTKQMEVLQHGLLYKAIRATGALPGIVPPITNENNEILIDGGVFNNLPADVMRGISPQSTIIAVRVSPSANILADIPEGVISGFQQFVGRFKKGRAQVQQFNMPNIAEIIAGSITLASDTHDLKVLKDIDYFLSMDLLRYGLMDFSKIHEVVETGYIEAMEFFSKRTIKS